MPWILKSLCTSCCDSASISVALGFYQPFRNAILCRLQESLFPPMCTSRPVVPCPSGPAPPSSLHYRPAPVPAFDQCSLTPRTQGLSFHAGVLPVLSMCRPPSHLLPPGWGCPASLSDPQEVCPSSSDTALLDPFALQSCLTMVSPSLLHP